MREKRAEATLPKDWERARGLSGRKERVKARVVNDGLSENGSTQTQKGEY